ncbi:tetratricopeptide repeat-containing sensor histidine kinase [Chryseobacterium sp. FH1]|uniref:tetratricopeptide repeat-containing sensor histidine kinase n=1 Tax=Chryseobacterium sp. FH1 TaxID=1233951 RepID=UPI000A889796|nr:tetratricopeptide repeat-containing sensor histidine kinase [Chryseobacterium sp. FH1]
MQKAIYCFLLLVLFSCSKKEIVENKKTTEKQPNPYYEKAFVFLDKNESDSAFYYLNKGRELFLKRNDSFGLGKSFVNMAIIQESEGDNFGSIETSLQAREFFDENNIAHFEILFCNYNNLGVASNNLKNYKDAKRFYDKALLFTKDPIDKMALANNIAIVYHNEKRYDKAVRIYEKLIDSVGSKSEFYPKLLLNYTRSKWFENPNYNPVKNYLHAEKLSDSIDDDWTRDASYAYLAAFFLDKKTDSAKLFAEKMLSLAKDLKYPVDQLEALQNLIRLSDGPHSQKYFDEYSRIQDSLMNAQNKAKNQFALIRFESEEAKAENLNLQKEKSVNEIKMLRQKIISWSVSLIAIAFGFLAFLWIRRKRKRMVIEANKRLQEQRLDLSKKVHDVVANGIYEVMSTIENQNDIPKEKILDKLELMYEKSRNLSYDNPLQQEFNERISGLISSFDNGKTKFIIIGNDPDFWLGINQFSQDELFQIIRELLVNMKKHSQATQVILRFIKENNSHEIKYFDNGIGLSESFVEKNGFSNMRSRLKEINGEFEIEGSLNGLKLSIKL